jgi:tetratricopeptide (TPR) repeat protein
MLRGRGRECAVLDAAVDDARRGRSTALVISGEPGMGKSALLAYAVQQAAGLPVLRTAGIESESELPFAGLHQLLRPVLDRVDRLPDQQAAMLRGALGLGPPRTEDRFLLCVAVLSLLAEAAEPDGLLCVVDDAQWLDDASAEALLFAARRLQAEGVALLFGARNGDGRRFDARGAPTLVLGGLPDDAAAALLADSAPRAMAPAVRRHLLQAAGGCPLALLELPAALTADQLAGRTALPDPLPVGAGVERVFAERVRHLPDDTGRLLLLAAADSSTDLGLVLAAAARLGLTAAALEPAESARLVTVRADRLEFGHPLVRSAVYRSASFARRCEAHQTLAACLPDDDVDRRAWHLSAAAVGPDPQVAEVLARAAAAAVERSAYAAAASAWERSAQLTDDDATRAGRLVAAAEAAAQAGRPEWTEATLGRAEPIAREPALRAVIAHLRGRSLARHGNVLHAYDTLVSGAELIADENPARAAEMLLDALEAALYGGDTAGAITAGLRATRLDSTDPDTHLRVCVAAGVAEALQGRFAVAVPTLREAVANGSARSQWPDLIVASRAAVALGDLLLAARLDDRAADAARVAGAIAALPRVLEFQAQGRIDAADLDTAESLAEEGLRLARDTGQDTFAAAHLANLAWVAALRGEEDRCATLAAEALDIALPRDLGLIQATVAWAKGSLQLGRGRWPEAAEQYRPLDDSRPGRGHPLISLLAAADRAEAAHRSGDPTGAEAALGRLRAWADATGHPAARAAVLRCRALLVNDAEAATGLLEQALALDGVPPMHQARARLLYGETLRRAKRRTAARGQLRARDEPRRWPH